MKTTPLSVEPLAATSLDLTGFQIPRVTLEGPLGKGSFGTVFRGRHRTLDIPVAIKRIDASLAPTQALDLALQEARLMARLDHPNLVRIFDAGRAAGGLYLVLELMDGGSLEGVRQLNEEALRSVARQALSGLQELHDARILHRDIKPANVLKRTTDLRIKLGDLGIAMLQGTQAGDNRSVGTLPFMAPELWSDPPLYSPRSDLYALGLTLVCLALDRDPFPTDSLPSLVSWVHRSPRPKLAELRPDLSPDLCALLAALTAHAPEQRPQSAAEALARLGGFPPSSSGPAATSTPGGRAVGAWRLGELAWSSANWESYIAHHCASGVPARWAHAIPGGATASAAEVIARGGALAISLDHPGFLPVLDWGELDGRPWVVTAPQGQSMIELCASQPLDELTAIAFGADLADALAYLHHRGFVYQAVAPGSVFIRQDARSVHLGWPWFIVPTGTAAVSGARSNRAGIPIYLPPEGFSASGTIDPPLDLWGLGEILFLLLTGRSPTDASPGGLMTILSSKLLTRPLVREYNPAVTAPTTMLVEALLDQAPERRPEAALVARELRRILGHLGERPSTR